MFSKLYRVLVKSNHSGSFQGTSQNKEGHITVEPNVINQYFYEKEDAIKLQQDLTEAGLIAKIVKGS